MRTITRNLSLAGLLLLGAGASVTACASGDDDLAGASSAVDESPNANAGAENPRLERRLTNMTERLALTEEQVALVRPILERMEAQRADLEDTPREERREAGRALHESFHAELEGVLTPEQLTQLETMRPGRRGFGRGDGEGSHGHRGPRFGRGGPPSPEQRIAHMKEDLGLTDAQVEAIRPIFARAHERHEALGDLEPEARREAGYAIREEVKTELAQVLTAEQQATLEARFAEHGPRGRRGGPHGRGHGRGHRGGGDVEGSAPGAVAPTPAADPNGI